MHELGIAMEIADVVTRRAEGARVVRVVVEIGALTLVLPDALQFSFELVTRETVAEDAELAIRERDGDELRILEMEVL